MGNVVAQRVAVRCIAWLDDLVCICINVRPADRQHLDALCVWDKAIIYRDTTKSPSVFRRRLRRAWPLKRIQLHLLAEMAAQVLGGARRIGRACEHQLELALKRVLIAQRPDQVL